MPAKMARSAHPPPFGVPGVMAVVRAANQTCQNTGNSQKFAAIRGSSGECRLRGLRKYVTKADVTPTAIVAGYAPFFWTPFFQLGALQ
jgi:hypothetical protein